MRDGACKKTAASYTWAPHRTGPMGMAVGEDATRGRPAWAAWACVPVLAWLAGLAWLHQQAELPSGAALMALGASALLLLAASAWLMARTRPRAGVVLLALSLGLLAFAQAGWRAQLRLAEELAPAWEGRDLVLSGRVDSLPVTVSGLGGRSGWRFEFEVEGREPAGPGLAPAVPARLLLAVYDGPAPTAGERWRLVVRLKRAHGLVNPGGFDGELWLFEQGLRATGVVRPGQAQRLSVEPWWGLDAARQRLRAAIAAHVAEPTRAGVLAALSLGDQAAITPADWALFRDTGVAHLLSVSGLHVTLFAWLAGGLIARVWRLAPALCLHCPAPWAARWGGVAAAWAYAAFSGWGVPAQRTVWMLVAVALLRSLGLRWPWPLVLGAAALVVTVADPWALLQAGFWLSFGAVALLMAGGEPPAQGWRDQLRAGLRTQLVATLGLAPLSLICFGQWSLVGLLANLLAIPLVSFVITPLALLGALWTPLWSLAGALVSVLMDWLQLLAVWPQAVWWPPAAPPWAQGLALLGALLLSLRLPWRLRGAGLLMLVPLLWPVVARPPPGEFELLAPDIGQGNAVLVRTAGHALLFDAGPVYAPGADAGERVLLPLLRRLGQPRLDLLVLSHRDSDHVGGAAALLRGLAVGGLLSSLEPGHPLLRLAAVAQRCEAGQRWQWDGVVFELLHPLAKDYGRLREPNALSCVLSVRSASGQRALLLGDLPAVQELALRQREPDLRADWLLVPHHGSRSSSSKDLLDAAAPRLALVQAGYRNRYGHPALTVLARYQAAGITVLASPACGAWRWQTPAEPGVQGCERPRQPRYWRDRPGPWEAGGPAADEMGEPLGPWPEERDALPP